MEPTYRPQHIREWDIKHEFVDVFGTSLPDDGFAKMWSSAASEERKLAMRKAKVWLDSRPHKSVLEAARITSSLLRDARNVARRKAVYENQ